MFACKEHLSNRAACTACLQVNEGSALNAGELIARMELDDPSKVKRAEKFTGTLPRLGPPQVYSDRVDHRFSQALNAAKMIMSGVQQHSHALYSIVHAVQLSPSVVSQHNPSARERMYLITA